LGGLEAFFGGTKSKNQGLQWLNNKSCQKNKMELSSRQQARCSTRYARIYFNC